ncbi:MAG TPA: hypothetical protein VKF16_05765 [Candidatus Dormibacteraeota bacterium]|nr:hypothetical protein [Candidatus Dormibacteraeota bacterium]
MWSRPFVIPLIAGCCIASFACTQSAPKPPPPHYRLTGAVRASCYQAPPAQPQGSCTMHAQIQNEGGPGRGGVGELILNYRPAGRADVVSATCDQAFPPLDTRDVAELDCFVVGDPPIYSVRIVSTDIKILPPPQPASAARRTFP